MLWCLYILLGPCITDVFVRKRFIEKMSMTEGRLLHNERNYTHLSAVEHNSVLHLKAAYDRVNPEVELLRASSPNGDGGTLLRATIYGGDVPQEELLRASTSEKQPAR